MNKTNVEYYYSKFDDRGKIAGAFPCDKSLTEAEIKHLINNGYIKITTDDFDYYIGNNGCGDNDNGYIRDSETGKPISAPPYVPSKEEKLAALDSQYNADKADLLAAYQTALVYGDTDTMDSLKADLEALDTKYDEDYEAIEEG